MRRLPEPVAALALALTLALSLAACGDDDGGSSANDDTGSSESSAAPTTSDDAGSTPAGPTETCEYTPDGSDQSVEPPPSDAPSSGTRTATVATSIGELTFELDAAGTPCTVNSFVSLAEQGYFDGTSCHRLTTQGIYVLQCGDPTATGRGGPGYTIPDEFPEVADYGPGALAMANTGLPNSGGSQFFIVYDGPETQLPPQYTLFGEVTEGIDLVAQAAAQGTIEGAPDGTPAVPVTLDSVTVD